MRLFQKAFLGLFSFSNSVKSRYNAYMKFVPTTPLKSLFIFLLSIPATFVHADDCAPKKIDVWVNASYALSGDSVNIQNKKFRLIGVEAPQIELKTKFNTNGQPLAKASQKNLNTLLANHNTYVGVEYDTARIDNFNRPYAHLFVKQGKKIINLQKLVLESGYALAKSTPPNNLHQKCYYQAEAKARRNQLGLWSIQKDNPQLNYPIAESSKLDTETVGYHIYRGKIVKVMKTSNNYVLNMDTTGIRIRKEDWDKFDYNAIRALEGKVIEARGYGFLYQRAMYVKVHSPFAIDQLNPIHQ